MNEVSVGKIFDHESIDGISPTDEPKKTTFPLDYYVELERKRSKNEKEKGKGLIKTSASTIRTQNLIKQLNNLAVEAEEKVKACIYESSAKAPSPVYSPISFNESDSGYTEHLVEAKFKELNYRKPKVSENIQQHQQNREEQPISFRSPRSGEINHYQTKYGPETVRSTAETSSSVPIPSNQISLRNSKTFNKSVKNHQYQIPKSNPQKYYPENQKSKEPQRLPQKAPNHECSCPKGLEVERNWVDSSKIISSRNIDDKLPTFNSHEKVHYLDKHFIDASVNTEPLSLKLNTQLLNVVSTHQEKIKTMRECIVNKPCQIQELPSVVIRPNFTKQIGPVIDIKTSKPSFQNNNVAVVECTHSGYITETKGNISHNIATEAGKDIGSQTVSPPAVHFRNSRDLKLLKVTTDLLGKLNFKDGANVEKLKRSLSNLIFLLNQVSPIHVANLRLEGLDATSASESIDTFFSNIDLVTEIVENEIKKPTGRYCDYPECLIKAVDLLCGNIKSIFVIDEDKKRRTKTAHITGEGKKKIPKKPSISNNRKETTAKNIDVLQRPFSSTSNLFEPDQDVSGGSDSKNLYIPYRMLIPGGKHKSMEEAKNAEEIELRFKRLEKVLKINQRLTKEIPITNRQHAYSEGVKLSSKDNHVLNETFIIKSASDDEEEREKINDEEKVNKSASDYEDDWEFETSKSNDGSMAMTEIKVEALVHSSNTKKLLPPYSTSKKNMDTENLSKDDIISQDYRKNLTASSSSHEVLSPSVCTSSKESQSYAKIKNKKDVKIREIKNKAQIDSKDVETQCDSNKKQVAAVYEDVFVRAQKSETEKVVQAHPIEAASFTVLRMTNPSTNSMLEVRFPEQSENLQSSLTVQKTINSEEIKLLYNLNKEEKILSWQGSDKVEDMLSSARNDKVLLNPDISKKVETNLSVPVQKTNEHLPKQNKEDLSDFQSITTNFIQFLEGKVTEMVGKFKLSEVLCEKDFDEKLTAHTGYKISQTSLNNFQINSSKVSSLKKDYFYKSASSLFSNQSNEDVPGVKNVLSRRCTPDNQGTIQFEDLTSPPIGLQFKEPKDVKNCSQITVNNFHIEDPQKNLAKVEIDNFLGQRENFEIGKQSETEEKTCNMLTNDVIKQSKLVLQEDKQLKATINELNNRLLPLPNDINDITLKNVNKEIEKVSSPSFVTLSPKKNYPAEEAISLDNSKSTLQIDKGIVKISNDEKQFQQSVILPKSQLFEQAMLALNNMNLNLGVMETEESTVRMVKTLHATSKNEDEINSQGTTISNICSILSASGSESSESSKFQTQNSRVILSNVNERMKETDEKLSKAVLPALSLDKDFPKLVLTPVPTEKKYPDNKNCDKTEEVYSNVSEHSLFFSGPSHVDKGLNSSCTFLKDFIENDDGQVSQNTAQILGINDTAIQSYDSSAMSAASSNFIAVKTIDLENLISSSRNSPTIDVAVETKIQLNNPLSLNAQNFNETLEADDISDLSDDYIHLKYFNPEVMSDGEIGYVYTSNSYSSGEIKPYFERTDDDSLNGPSTFREINKHVTERKSGNTHSNNGNKLSETINQTELQLQNLDIGPIFENPVEAMNSSIESTSTGELKNLFNVDEKVDEGILFKLIDIHARCSTSLSSASSCPVDYVESIKKIDEDL